MGSFAQQPSTPHQTRVYSLPFLPCLSPISKMRFLKCSQRLSVMRSQGANSLERASLLSSHPVLAEESYCPWWKL